MKLKTLFAASALLFATLPGLSQARDTAHFLDFHAVVKEATDAGRLDGSVKFYLAGNRVSGQVSKLRQVSTNKKTNAFNKSDEAACSWVLQSALVALQDSAKRAGANAVIDIASNYKQKEYKDASKYECHAGAVIAGVALKGQLAKVK